MSIARYAVVDGSGNVQNVVMWDGVSDYPLADGLTLAAIGEMPVGVGWKREAEGFAAPPVVQAPVPTGPRYVPFPTVCDRVRAAGKWDAFVAMWQTLPAATQLHLQTLTEGVASDDAQVTAALTGIGCDPTAILAA